MPESKKTTVPSAPATNPESAYAVVGNGETDEIRLSRIVYKNDRARMSLSVHHLQRRLGELGFDSGLADESGYYGDLTRDAVEAFQVERKIPAEPKGVVDEQTLRAVFDNDPNVTISNN